MGGRMRKTIRSAGERSGSTLGWVMVVMMVVMIFMMSALSMSASHVYRYQSRHNKRQIHMTAASAAGAIAEDLENPAGEGGFGKILDGMLEDAEEGEVELTGLDERMGEMVLLYRYDGENLVLTVRVRLGTETGETSLIMKRGEDGEDHPSWNMTGYGAGEAEPIMEEESGIGETPDTDEKEGDAR